MKKDVAMLALKYTDCANLVISNVGWWDLAREGEMFRKIINTYWDALVPHVILEL